VNRELGRGFSTSPRPLATVALSYIIAGRKVITEGSLLKRHGNVLKTLLNSAYYSTTTKGFTFYSVMSFNKMRNLILLSLAQYFNIKFNFARWNSHASLQVLNSETRPNS
jgi:hypothetical protein